MIPSARIGEGENAVFYHMGAKESTADLACDKIVDTVDSDTIAIALLNCRDRIDPITKCFRDRVFVTMVGADKQTVFVDINALYDGIKSYYRERCSSIRYPVETHIFLMLLSGCDFVTDTYCHGKTHMTVFEFMMKEGNVQRYRNMVLRRDMMPLRRGETFICMMRAVEISPTLFRMFSHDLYCSAFGGALAKSLKVSPMSITYADIRREKQHKYLENVRKYKAAKRLYEDRTEKGLDAKKPRAPSPKSVPPTDDGLAVIGRTCAYTLLYWLNTYYTRIQQKTYVVEFECTRKLGGVSMWGYERDDSGRVVFATKVNDTINLTDVDNVFYAL
jgi:hypothetical protein